MNLVGNRVRRTVDLASTPALVDQVFSSEYDANDRLLEETLDLGNDETIDQITTYDWGVSAEDPDGVTQQLGTSVRNGAGDTTSRQVLSYNLQGQLAAVVSESFDGSGDVTARSRVSYQYDLAGIRNIAIEAADADLNNEFSNSETTGSTEYLIDHQSLTGYPQTMIETIKNAAGQPIRRVSYTFGLDEITQTVSQLDPATEAVTTSDRHTFGHDAHGSVRVLVDAAGAILQAYSYTAFGELLAIHDGSGIFLSASAEDALTNLLYSGEAFDSRTGWQSLRARWYRPETGRFERSDPILGDPSSPFSFNKYAYTSGDPIQFGDPSGLFEGLAGILSSLNISMNNRASQAPGHGQSLATANRFQKLVRLIDKLHSKLQKLEDALDLFDNATNILELTSQDRASLMNSFNILSAIPPTKIGPMTIPLPSKITQKLKQFVRLARKFGGLKFLQEQIGEWGAAIAANAVGLRHTKMKLHSPQGIDQLRRHTNPSLGFWAVIEAKGGTSRLEKATGYGPEMSPKWIRHWLDDTIRRNVGQERTKLLQAKATAAPMLAAVVRVNAEKVTWQVKITVNKFRWTTPTLNWSGA